MKLRRLAPLMIAGALAARADSPLDPPPAKDVAEAREIVAAMKKSPRGPFERLRWFCNDGTVHPPQPYPCGEGGGEQHGEYSASRQRLADLGWHVGTVFAATSWDELWSSPRHQRLRELALERYMTDVDDGFVLRSARDYRGAFQIEDEEKDGRALLLQLMAQPDVARDDFLLLRESVRAIPHVGENGDRTRDVRRQSKELADADKSFDRIRIRIHNDPSASDATATRAWADAAETAGTDPALVAKARSLADSIDALYGATGRRERLMATAQRARTSGVASSWIAESLDAAAAAAGARGRADALCALLRRLREAAETEPDAARRLALLDLSIDVEAEAVAAGVEAARDASLSRRDLLALAASLLDGGYGAGLLSALERDVVAVPAKVLATQDQAPVAQELATARGLERAAGWGAGTVRYSFGEAIARYAALDAQAAKFTDDVLRGSTMLPLADVASRLARDAERQSGLLHSVFGAELPGLAGLNPGVAVGTLRVVATDADLESAHLDPHDVVVLPSTTADLVPVGGILTVSEGNALSHVQMLARNLGIPNAVVPPSALASLQAQAGQRVVYAVSPNGSVAIARADAIDKALLDSLTGEAKRAALAQKVPAPVPDLSVRRLIPLSELNASLSGKLVGPKAANVGELARHFPERVAQAVAIPFGLYAQHAANGPGSAKARLDAAFAAMRAGTLDQAGLEREIDAVRAQVEALTIDAPTRAALQQECARLFGEPGTYGVFVRSDTNVEDLPQFTGAGLNKTIPNVVGFEQMLAAVPKVWASAFTQRAMAWRMQALTNPEEVYPSVLLMKSVPSEKSGVLVTTDVATGGEGITVSAAWGVGGAVDGESAETLVLRPDGSVTIVAEAKAPWRRRLASAGGVEWVPADSGRVLTDDEIAAVRSFVDELRSKVTPSPDDSGKPLPWDVEFAFVEGQMKLLQLRPLVERGGALADRVVRTIAPPRAIASATLDLSGQPAR